MCEFAYVPVCVARREAVRVVLVCASRRVGPHLTSGVMPLPPSCSPVPSFTDGRIHDHARSSARTGRTTEVLEEQNPGGGSWGENVKNNLGTSWGRHPRRPEGAGVAPNDTPGFRRRGAAMRGSQQRRQAPSWASMATGKQELGIPITNRAWHALSAACTLGEYSPRGATLAAL